MNAHPRLAAAVAMALLVLPSCRQKDTGPSPANTGGVAAAQDKDRDGIPDEWEVNGVEYTDPLSGQKLRLDLKQQGASPSHKDIILWIASMKSSDHTHEPDTESLAIVERAFRAAPVTNPDGFPGINVHVFKSPAALAEQPVLGSGTALNYDWSEFDAAKKAHLPPELQGTAFFAVFAHDITAQRNSGIARSIPGRDFIVSLGGFTKNVGTRQEKAGTLMHELGHALGLGHGGRDHVTFKPNYLSVMNYSFQLNGIAIAGVQGNYDYSRFKLDLPEAALDEKAGLAGSAALAKYSTIFYCCSSCQNTPGKAARVSSLAALPVDWNCDRTVGAKVSSDVNRDASVTALTGATDWDHIVLTQATGGMTPNNVLGAGAEELTPAQADALPLFPVSDVHVRPIGNGILVEWEPVPLERVVAYHVYRGAAGAADERVAIVENVQRPSFADVQVTSGSYRYSVTAVFVPHAAEPVVPPSPAPAPPPPSSSGTATLGPGTWISGIVSIRAVQEAAPTTTAAIETLGGVTPQDRAPEGFTRVLRETDRSAAATVVIK
jgi:hypothetical protein